MGVEVDGVEGGGEEVRDWDVDGWEGWVGRECVGGGGVGLDEIGGSVGGWVEECVGGRGWDGGICEVVEEERGRLGVLES